MFAGQKQLVFAYHKSVLDLLEEGLKKQKLKYIRIDGTTPDAARQKAVAKFQKQKSTDIALLAIMAANVSGQTQITADDHDSNDASILECNSWTIVAVWQFHSLVAFLLVLHVLACATGSGARRYLDVLCMQAGGDFSSLCWSPQYPCALASQSAHASLNSMRSICVIQCDPMNMLHAAAAAVGFIVCPTRR